MRSKYWAAGLPLGLKTARAIKKNQKSSHGEGGKRELTGSRRVDHDLLAGYGNGMNYREKGRGKSSQITKGYNSSRGDQQANLVDDQKV